MTNATHDSQSKVFLNRTTKADQSAIDKLEAQIADLDRRVDEALQEEGNVEAMVEKPSQITIWGVPFSYVTLAGTLRYVDHLIAQGKPEYFITANLNYNMLTAKTPGVPAVNDKAAFIVCDGMPMVWWSRLLGKPLPERVAGSELIYALTKWAAIKGHRIFFLGGAPGVAANAAQKLQERYPGLEVAGVECPPFRPLTDEETSEMIDRIRASKPDILYCALGQPKGEIWMSENCEKIGVPVSVQLGASFDFVAGGVARAPIWIQKIGMVWAYRLYQEPKRLFGRYWNNGTFLLRSVCMELFQRGNRQTA
ncbi:MAG: WecB/TagA/CpsF family glycosyltransferase [Planctomycetota bacterium]